MGLFDDLQKNTRTKQEFAQSQKEAQEQKRINALNQKIDYIKKCIIEETKAAANKGIRNITMEPYYLYEWYDSSSGFNSEKFHTQVPYCGIKGHILHHADTKRQTTTMDIYDVVAVEDSFGHYGYILPDDRPYIIAKTEEFLKAEGFKVFKVAFEKEYLNPNAAIFKSPTGRNVLKIHLSW